MLSRCTPGVLWAFLERARRFRDHMLQLTASVTGAWPLAPPLNTLFSMHAMSDTQSLSFR